MNNQMRELGGQELLNIEGGTEIGGTIAIGVAGYALNRACQEGEKVLKSAAKATVDHFKNHKPSGSYANNSYMNSMTGRN